MLDLEYIKNNTLWVIKYSSHRITIKGSELSKYQDDDDIRDMDTVTYRGQPKELQEFWRAYEYAIYKLARHDLYLVDDFYREWSKNPDQFKAEHRTPLDEPLCDLLDEQHIITKNPKQFNVLIINYDKRPIGNHSLVAWRETLKRIDDNFDVIFCEYGNMEAKITIQCDNDELLDRLSNISNSIAINYAFK